MARAVCSALAAALLLGAAPPERYQIDLSRYFSNSVIETQSRAKLASEAEAFAASPTPTTVSAMRQWLAEYDKLLRGLERHDIYVYLRAEEDDRDRLDANADDHLGELEGRINDRVARAAKELGPTRIASFTRSSSLQPYRYLLDAGLYRSAHQLSAADARTVTTVATPVLDAAAASYKALRKSSQSVASDQAAYAALLVSIAAARNGIARLRRFTGAPEAAYFDRFISAASVERTLDAIRKSNAYARYQSVAAHAPQPGYSPPPFSVTAAIPLILAAEQPMGAEYAAAYAALLDRRSRRLDICDAPVCDRTGFSVGFAGAESAVYFGSYNGSVNSVRALAHESGHAVHRQFMSLNQPIAAYNAGPAFMFESFAIFNELLFLDHLYRTAPNSTQRAFYLDDFLNDATFQVFGSAEETDLESAIYRGVAAGTLRTAADFDALTTKVFTAYDPAGAQAPDAALYWARNRLFFTDPLYDVNYMYAGLLALQYFADLQSDPGSFPQRYVALLKNGFNDAPAALEKRFLGIDFSNEAGLVANGAALIDTRTRRLSKIYSEQTPEK
ncbi:MAG TPA: M3 family metallopeptidase [Candidatus Cybelea sp.]|nr:M3 family metallopeptidase [Candidatus Cybelea sp.]